MQHKQKVLLRDFLLGAAIFGGLTWSFMQKWDFSLIGAVILAGLLTPLIWFIRLMVNEFSK
jgi:hypothetical protein